MQMHEKEMFVMKSNNKCDWVIYWYIRFNDNHLVNLTYSQNYIQKYSALTSPKKGGEEGGLTC